MKMSTFFGIHTLIAFLCLMSYVFFSETSTIKNSLIICFIWILFYTGNFIFWMLERSEQRKHNIERERLWH